MTGWMKRHRFLTALAVVLLLASCGAVLGEEPEGTDASDSSAPAPEETPPKSEEPTDEPTEEPVELTPEEQWAVNVADDESALVSSVAAALAVRPRRIGDVRSGALQACASANEDADLDVRVGEVQQAYGLPRAPAYDRATAALAATLVTVCPELVDVHRVQVAERAEQLKVEERRRKRQEARQARRQREREAESTPAPAPSIYYENCSAVEAAGAAPIYRGQPGYGTHLDRDGDGVACEQ